MCRSGGIRAWDVRAFTIAQKAALSPEERWYYEGSLKQARIENARLAAALEMGHEKGLQEGLQQGLRQGLEQGALAGKRAVRAGCWRVNLTGSALLN